MIKKKISVGAEYKNAFDSIKTLINGRCFDGLPYTVDGDVISDGAYEYVLSERSNNKDKREKFIFEEKGATWFKALRGVKTSDDDAIWNTFMNNAIIEYHKRYSVVEYKRSAPTKTDSEKHLEFAINAVKQFCTVFYPDLKDLVQTSISKNPFILEDVYGVAIKIELSGGTGESLPVLGKVYFNRIGNKMMPISASTASILDMSINSIIPEDQTQNPPSLSDRVVDTALDAMKSVIDNPDSNFADYLCFSDEFDAEAVRGLLAKLSHDAIELECQRVDVLYISHIETNSFEYVAHIGGLPAFNVNVDINNYVTITCASCKTLLVDKNQLHYTNEYGENLTLELDFNSEDLGVEGDAQEIKILSGLDRHFMPISCRGIQGKNTCTTYKCESQLLDVVEGGQHKLVCKDCPYPEVIYTSPSGEKLYTPNLIFAFDRMELVKNDSEEPIGRCRICGRAFSESKLSSGKCPCCNRALKRGEPSKQEKWLYKKYKSFLSLGARAKFTKVRYCVEDQEVIIFVVGKQSYLFSKLNVKDSGYIEKPKKLARRV